LFNTLIIFNVKQNNKDNQTNCASGHNVNKATKTHPSGK